MSEASHVMPIRHAIDGQVQALYQENCELKFIIGCLKDCLSMYIDDSEYVDKMIEEELNEYRTNQGKDFNSQENTSNS